MTTVNKVEDDKADKILEESDSLIDSLLLEEEKRPVIGTLFITVSKATIHRNTELIGKMDPFIELEYEGTRKKTETCLEGGINPVWDQTFTFEIYSLDDNVRL